MLCKFINKYLSVQYKIELRKYSSQNIQIFYGFEHDAKIINLIKLIKYKNSLFALCKIAHVTEAMISQLIIQENIKNFIILPIPTTPLTKLLRGHNHTQSIIKQTVFKHNMQNILAKTPLAKRQTRLNKTQRQKNIQKALYLKDISIDKNKTYIIFDDISTTGATLKKAKKLLKKAGVKKVYSICLVKN